MRKISVVGGFRFLSEVVRCYPGRNKRNSDCSSEMDRGTFWGEGYKKLFVIDIK